MQERHWHLLGPRKQRGGAESLTVFGVIIRKRGGIVRIGGIPAQLSALCVVHGDGVFYRDGANT